MAARLLTFGLSGVTFGGIEAFVVSFRRHLQEACVFDFVLLENNTIQAYTEDDARGRVFQIAPYWSHPFSYIRDIVRLFKAQRDAADAVYCNVFNTLHIWPVLIARLMGLKVIVHAHNNRIPSRNVLYRMGCLIGKQLLRRCECLRLSNSDDSTAFIFGRDRIGKTHVIYNAIDIEQFRYNAPVREQIRKEWGVGDKVVVGFSGRLLEQKNPLFAVRVFEQFHRMHPESVLVMAGEGTMRTEVEAWIEKNGLKTCVLLTGKSGQMGRLYQGMDLFLLPSLFEGLGIVLIEAQCAGLPCLTTADTIPDLVDATELIEREPLSSTPRQWAEHLEKLFQKRYKERAAYSNEIAASRFNVRTEAHRFARLVEQYIHEPAD